MGKQPQEETRIIKKDFPIPDNIQNGDTLNVLSCSQKEFKSRNPLFRRDTIIVESYDKDMVIGILQTTEKRRVILDVKNHKLQISR